METHQTERSLLPNGVESIITVTGADAAGYKTTYIFIDTAGLQVSLPVTFGRLEDAKEGCTKLTEDELMELHQGIVEMVTGVHNSNFEESLDRELAPTKLGETK